MFRGIIKNPGAASNATNPGQRKFLSPRFPAHNPSPNANISGITSKIMPGYFVGR